MGLSLEHVLGSNRHDFHRANGKRLGLDGRHLEGETFGSYVLTRGVTHGDGSVGRGGKQFVEPVVTAKRQVGLGLLLRSEIHFQLVGSG